MKLSEMELSEMEGLDGEEKMWVCGLKGAVEVQIN